jgi:hypothetical protein
MPCTDDGIPWPRTREQELSDKSEAMLCAVMRALLTEYTENKVLELLSIRWKRGESGVSFSDFKEWWQRHKAKDARREALEAEQNKRDALRRTALAKLTKEEKEAILEGLSIVTGDDDV